MDNIKLEKVNDVQWKIPIGTVPNMKVPGIVFASKILLDKIKQDNSLAQLANVATLPGIQKHALVMPDAHQGYGFPIGGVAALDCEEGGISPGGIGYDINCGVRLLLTNLTEKDVKPVLPKLVDTIFNNIPAGVGRSGKLKLTRQELDKVLRLGAKWAVESGYGWDEDLKHMEEEGCLDAAKPEYLTASAYRRGAPQLGTLGAGNHFLEIQKVDNIFNEKIAKAFGVDALGKICIMIHTGSRGLGHQNCADYIREIENAHPEIVANLPDRELVYAPAGSKMAERYFGAMCAASNFAWANRQLITHWIRESFQSVFKKKAEELGMNILYDVCHNIAKVENHKIDNKMKKVFVHRKGATRAYGPGNKDIPKDYQKVGQPVLIPGSMGTASYVLVGSETAEEVSFASTCHGAGRVMSRTAANNIYRGDAVKNELASKGILVKSASWRGITEEAPGAYKDIDEVARVSDAAGIAHLVFRLRPMGVVKG